MIYITYRLISLPWKSNGYQAIVSIFCHRGGTTCGTPLLILSTLSLCPGGKSREIRMLHPIMFVQFPKFLKLFKSGFPIFCQIRFPTETNVIKCLDLVDSKGRIRYSAFLLPIHFPLRVHPISQSFHLGWNLAVTELGTIFDHLLISS